MIKLDLVPDWMAENVINRKWSYDEFLRFAKAYCNDMQKGILVK